MVRFHQPIAVRGELRPAAGLVPGRRQPLFISRLPPLPDTLGR